MGRNVLIWWPRCAGFCLSLYLYPLSNGRDLMTVISTNKGILWMAGSQWTLFFKFLLSWNGQQRTTRCYSSPLSGLGHAKQGEATEVDLVTADDGSITTATAITLTIIINTITAKITAMITAIVIIIYNYNPNHSHNYNHNYNSTTAKMATNDHSHTCGHNHNHKCIHNC